MKGIVSLLPSLVSGFLLGTLFFGSLWWTVQHGILSKRPALWFMGGMMLRTSVTLTGFYFVMRGDWEKLAVCLLGFIMARTIATQVSYAT
jgi:F1F0 ATPase subunit 2